MTANHANPPQRALHRAVKIWIRGLRGFSHGGRDALIGIGHYSRRPTMQKIFKAVKWLGQRLFEAAVREAFRSFLEQVRDQWDD